MGSISRFVVVNELGVAQDRAVIEGILELNHEYRRVLDPNGRVDVVFGCAEARRNAAARAADHGPSTSALVKAFNHRHAASPAWCSRSW